MRAVIPEVLPESVAWRRRAGIDRWDEMWEGEFHMPPAPNRSHQDFQWELQTWLRSHWTSPSGNRVHGEVNVAAPGGWPNNYRIPDLVLLTPDCSAIDHDVYIEGAPSVVVEICSPGDETMEKLPFYARLGVAEVWVVDRDTKVPNLYVLSSGQYENQPAASDGWVRSAATGVQLRGDLGNRLAVQLASDESTRRLLPEQ